MTTVTRLHASDHTFTDTETTIEFNLDGESSAIFVTVRMVPGLRYWSCPPSELMRYWIDSAIRDSGYRRNGARVEISSGMRTWKFVYYVTPRD
jgi:hypothetical protein